MTSPAGRLYALALTLVVFFLAWAVLASRPWATAAPDPRLRELAVREAALRREARHVERVVARRLAAYRRALHARRAAIAAAAVAAPAPASVRIVTLPPLTITRTS